MFCIQVECHYDARYLLKLGAVPASMGTAPGVFFTLPAQLKSANGQFLHALK